MKKKKMRNHGKTLKSVLLCQITHNYARLRIITQDYARLRKITQITQDYARLRNHKKITNCKIAHLETTFKFYFMSDCDCCIPPKRFKDRHAQRYHRKKNLQRSLTDLPEMSVTKKASKQSASLTPVQFFLAHMTLLEKAVCEDNFKAGIHVETAIRFMNDTIEEDSESVVELCEGEKTAMEANNYDAIQDRIEHHKASTAEERLFLDKLWSKYKDGKEEFVDANGIPNAGTPTGFILTEENLTFMLHDMNARCDSIKHEIKRRKDLPKLIIWRKIIDTYKEKQATGYSQCF
jgi:hypothetical protein